MKRNIDHLLGQHLSRTASREERNELFTTILSGIHDEWIGDIFEQMMDTEFRFPATVEERVPLTRVFHTTLSASKNGILYSGPPKTLSRHTSVKKRWWMAAAAIVVIVAAGWIVKNYTDAKPIAQYIRLSDGSTVLLNEGSTLHYSKEGFGKHSREVTLLGEAYFDVKPHAALPFRVHAAGLTTTVLGTAFNINAWPRHKHAIVTVTRGKVEVRDDKHIYGQIIPGQQIRVNTATGDFVQTEVKAATVLAWKSKYLILDRVTMAEAAQMIAEKYAVKIIIVNEELKKCRISATFLREERLSEVLEVVTGLTGMMYSIDNGKVTIDGNAGNCR